MQPSAFATTVPPVSDSFFGEVHSYLTDGAVMDGKLIAVEDNESISVYEGTNVEPTVYKWRDAGERSINAVVAGSDGIYVIYADGHGNSSSSFNLDYVPLAYGLGCVTLDESGAFDLTTLAEVPATAILDPEGRKLNSYGIQDTVLTGGKLYFTAEYAVESELEGFGYAPQHVRLFSWDLTEAAPSEFDLEGIPVDWSPELFGGGDGAYLAAYDDRAAAARVYRAEDSALKPLCEIPWQRLDGAGHERGRGQAHCGMRRAFWAGADAGRRDLRRASRGFGEGVRPDDPARGGE